MWTLKAAADTEGVRRLAAAVFVLLVLGTSVTTAAARTSAAPSWAKPQIAAVVEAGLMASSAAEFRPDDPLTSTELADVVASLGGAATVDEPDRLVTMRELDAQLVTLTGLRRAASRIRLAAVGAGLTPKPWIGTETVARLLGFRVNHERGTDELELQPLQPATRAEAAFSIARFLALDAAEIESVRAIVQGFVVTDLSGWQRRVLARAVRFVGSPYVWAGTSEHPQQLLGRILPGGFDCSGFVWRIYKLEDFAGAPLLGQVLKGRSSYEMSGEVPASARITRAQLRPGDIAFFGSRGPRSRPSEVGHMGIYVGNGWIVHSSRFGTTLAPMTDWYETSFAWGRRPLAEARVSDVPPGGGSGAARDM